MSKYSLYVSHNRKGTVDGAKWQTAAIHLTHAANTRHWAIVGSMLGQRRFTVKPHRTDNGSISRVCWVKTQAPLKRAVVGLCHLLCKDSICSLVKWADTALRLCTAAVGQLSVYVSGDIVLSRGRWKPISRCYRPGMWRPRFSVCDWSGKTISSYDLLKM